MRPKKGEFTMTIAHMTLNHLLPKATSPWNARERTDAAAKAFPWMGVVRTIMIVGIIVFAIFMLSNHFKTREMEELVQLRAAFQGQVAEARKGVEEMKGQLIKANTVVESLQKKELGSATIINNLTVSRQALANEFDQARTKWEQERKQLESRFRALEESQRKALAATENKMQSAAVIVATGGAEGLMLDQALSLSKKGGATGCVQGDCQTGQGAWRFDNGDIYVGMWSNGLKDGQGLYRYNQGTWYFGGWSNDLKQGYGIYHFASGARYEGGWLKGNRHGPGVDISASGKTTQGQWVHGRKNA
ncbi:MAG: hypothetical protein HQL78_11525 [Magnetococcales bacterium]|nr:hypothetical protein [Magnetococcales bacterium]